jgi:hypothetical protein
VVPVLLKLWIFAVSILPLALFSNLPSSFEVDIPSQIEDSAITASLDSATHLPMNRTQSFDVTDKEVYSWLSFANVSSPPRNVTWIWLTPAKHQYLTDQAVIPDPGAGKSWSKYIVWSNIKINGTAVAQLTGLWTVGIFVGGVQVKVQNFWITDSSSPLYQPTEGYSWPIRNIYVNIRNGPQYARQDVINAMKQWNNSQTWFQKTYGLTPLKPIYNLILSNNTSDTVQITFNQTQTSRDWGYTQSNFSWDSSSNKFTQVTANISIILSLNDGTTLDNVAIQTIATHELGHLLGLAHVEHTGDLMNTFVGNFYDVKTPTTLNLYTIYQISNITEYGSIPSYYTLPNTIPYIQSPHNITTQTTTSTTTIAKQEAAKIVTVNITHTVTQPVTITTTINLTKTISEPDQSLHPLLLTYIVSSLITILTLAGLLLLTTHRTKQTNIITS